LLETEIIQADTIKFYVLVYVIIYRPLNLA